MKVNFAFVTLCAPLAIIALQSCKAFAGDKCTVAEKHRLLFDNTEGGQIRGSKDGGKTWTVLGTIKIPIQGEYWIPGKDNGVLAYNFLRGESNVFASAVNNLHIRFSDPSGYTLPADINIPPIDAHGVTFAPIEELANAPIPKRIAITSMHGGTGIFSEEWSPRIGDVVSMGDGSSFEAIPYDYKLSPNDTAHNKILIVTNESTCGIEYIEFENHAEGKVYLKEKNHDAVAVAKVKQPVRGVGRFIGSEFISQPGVIRANHAGVFDIGTTDYQLDPNAPRTGDINEYRGGFQVVPSHHYADPSMSSGGDHPFVYMVVGPLIDPPNLKRYDMGVEARYPLFFQGLRADMGKTLLRFEGSDAWVEINDAIARGYFKSDAGTAIYHLRGVLPNVLSKVTNIRVMNELPPQLPLQGE